MAFLKKFFGGSSNDNKVPVLRSLAKEKSMSFADCFPFRKDLVTVGRDDTADIVLDSSKFPRMISRTHATFFKQTADSTGKKLPKPIWVLEDKKSTNGSFVNNIKIEKRELRDQDKIVFGGGMGLKIGDSRPEEETEFIFVFEEAAVISPTMKPANLTEYNLGSTQGYDDLFPDDEGTKEKSEGDATATQNMEEPVGGESDIATQADAFADAMADDPKMKEAASAATQEMVDIVPEEAQAATQVDIVPEEAQAATQEEKDLLGGDDESTKGTQQDLTTELKDESSTATQSMEDGFPGGDGRPPAPSIDVVLKQSASHFEAKPKLPMCPVMSNGVCPLVALNDLAHLAAYSHTTEPAAEATQKPADAPQTPLPPTPVARSDDTGSGRGGGARVRRRQNRIQQDDEEEKKLELKRQEKLKKEKEEEEKKQKQEEEKKKKEEQKAAEEKKKKDLEAKKTVQEKKKEQTDKKKEEIKEKNNAKAIASIVGIKRKGASLKNKVSKKGKKEEDEDEEKEKEDNDGEAEAEEKNITTSRSRSGRTVKKPARLADTDEDSEKSGSQPKEQEELSEESVKKFTVPQLRAALAKRGLGSSGKKSDLIARLIASLKSDPPKSNSPTLTPTTPAVDTASVPDYSSWTLDLLRAELNKRGLDSRGRKPALVSRLEQAHAQAPVVATS